MSWPFALKAGIGRENAPRPQKQALDCRKNSFFLATRRLEQVFEIQSTV
jgi:hypothetical protein